ncbi:MAG: PPOX class F420-dependent oxidoreductase [Dehalococcoidia bacterium]
MSALTKEQMESFLAEKRNAIVATIRKDGTPQVTPVWFEWDGEVFRFSITKDRAKYPNLRRDPRLALCIDEDQGPPRRYVTVYGRAELDDRPEAILEPMRRIRRQYRGEAAAAATTLAELERDRRVLVTVRPQRMVSWELPI